MSDVHRTQMDLVEEEKENIGLREDAIQSTMPQRDGSPILHGNSVEQVRKMFSKMDLHESINEGTTSTVRPLAAQEAPNQMEVRSPGAVKETASAGREKNVVTTTPSAVDAVEPAVVVARHHIPRSPAPQMNRPAPKVHTPRDRTSRAGGPNAAPGSAKAPKQNIAAVGSMRQFRASVTRRPAGGESLERSTREGKKTPTDDGKRKARAAERDAFFARLSTPKFVKEKAATPVNVKEKIASVPPKASACSLRKDPTKIAHPFAAPGTSGLKARVIRNRTRSVSKRNPDSAVSPSRARLPSDKTTNK